MTAFFGIRVGVVVAVAVWGLLFGPVSPAGAAFPGGVGKIAFDSDRGGSTGIYVMNANGSGQTRLTTNFTVGSDNFPAWSPTGTKIAFESSGDIKVMNADGSGQTQLTTNRGDDLDPAWSPDGTTIAFASIRGSHATRAELWVMNPDGSGQTQVTSAGLGCCRGDEHPNWSPDGSKIAFSSDRDSFFGDREIYVVNAGGSGLDAGLRRLTNNSLDDFKPAWSPDGRTIAFTSRPFNANGRAALWVMNADGSGQTQLTTNPADDADPDWQPVVKADLAVSVTHGSFNPATRRLTWTTTVSNAGPQRALVASVDEGIGPTRFVSASSSAGSCPGASEVGISEGFTCSLGQVNPGASQTVQVVVQVPATASRLSNIATVTADTPDPNTANNTASQSVTLPTADLALSVVATQLINYQMTVTNKGPDPAGGIVLNDALPGRDLFGEPEVGFIGVSGVPATACAPVPSVGSTGLVSCSLGSLASGASITVGVQAQVKIATTLIDTASIRSLTTDPNPDNNSVTVSTPVSSVGIFRLTPARAAARPGSTVHLHITWIAPHRWRELRTVELELLDGRRLAGLVRFRNDRSKAGRLSLGAGSGKPGAQRVLRTGALSLLLADSRVTGSGPTGKTVRIDLALRVGHQLAGHTLTLKLGATNRKGTRQPFRRAGSLTIHR